MKSHYHNNNIIHNYRQPSANSHEVHAAAVEIFGDTYYIDYQTLSSQ